MGKSNTHHSSPITHSYLGIDFGTSGARAALIDAYGEQRAEARCGFEAAVPEQLAESWRATLFHLLEQIPLSQRQTLRAIAIDGTSATMLLCDAANRPLCPPLLYNDSRAAAQAEQLAAIAPSGHTVLAATSSLAKLLWFAAQPEFPQARYLVHQADWLASLLHGQPGISDYHNSLKLGYDAEHLRYPGWLLALPVARVLPQVVAPGAPIGPVLPGIARRFSLPDDCLVRAGTTDSIAAFLASGVSQPGDAVTSLGSTLALKLLSTRRIEAAGYGIYSHRLGNLWLAGGASNSGGAVLKQFFDDARLVELSRQINPRQDSGLDYYPLPRPGERFPLNDPKLPPRLTPRPEDDSLFLQGMLEGMARIEARGYRLLDELGATPLRRVLTAGGGASNRAWTTIRERVLEVPVAASARGEAAYGAALLALKAIF